MIMSMTDAGGSCKFSDDGDLGGLIEYAEFNSIFPFVEYCMVEGEYILSSKEICKTLDGIWTERPEYYLRRIGTNLTHEEMYKCDVLTFKSQVHTNGTKAIWLARGER